MTVLLRAAQIHLPPSRISHGCPLPNPSHHETLQLYLRLPRRRQTILEERLVRFVVKQ